MKETNFNPDDLLTCISDHQIFKENERYSYKDIVAHKVFNGGENLTLAEIKKDILFNFNISPFEVSFEGYVSKIYINSEMVGGVKFDRALIPINMENGVVLEGINTKLSLFKDPDKFLCVGKKTRVKITLTEIIE